MLQEFWPVLFELCTPKQTRAVFYDVSRARPDWNKMPCGGRYSFMWNPGSSRNVVIDHPFAGQFG